MYGNCILIDGPHKGEHVPFHGMPRYGTMIELARHVDGGLFRSPRDVTDIYKVIEEDYDAAKARFVGTIEHPREYRTPPWTSTDGRYREGGC